MTTRFAGFLLAVGILLAAAPGFSQAPRTISHQGLLTDTSGDPVADASRSMTFKIYNASAGGTQLWSETKNVSTVNGIFFTELGSVTPLSGVDFDQELWLSIKVGTDAEMPQRTKLTSVPNAIGLVMPYRDSLRIETLDLGTDGSEIFGDDISVHAGDAFLGLYSNDIGIAGSGLYLAEIAAGSMTNKWSIYRSTTGAQSSLRFTFGSDPQYALNPLVMQLDPAGRLTVTAASPNTTAVRGIGINTASTVDGVYGETRAGKGVYGRALTTGFGGYFESTSNTPDVQLAGRGVLGADQKLELKPTDAIILNPGDDSTSVSGNLYVEGNAKATAVLYNDPRTHYYSINAAAFRPLDFSSSTTAAINNGFAYVTATSGLGRMGAPVNLPDGARLKEMSCYMTDDDPGQNLFCRMEVTILTGGIATGFQASVETSGTPGFVEESTTTMNLSDIVDNENRAYMVNVGTTSGSWATDDLRIHMVVIRYEMDEAQ